MAKRSQLTPVEWEIELSNSKQREEVFEREIFDTLCRHVGTVFTGEWL